MVTRSSNNFGPWQFPEKVIPLFVTNLLDGANVPLYGDGLNRRDWLFVEDNCAAIDLVLRSGKDGEIYNIGAGNELTNRELTDKLLGSGRRGPDRVDYVTDRLGHDRRYCIDSSKVRALGWEPGRDLDGTLAKTCQWYRDNRWWWGRLRRRRGEGTGHGCFGPGRLRAHRIAGCSTTARCPGPRSFGARHFRPGTGATGSRRMGARGHNKPGRVYGGRRVRGPIWTRPSAVNALGPRNLAEGARLVGAHLVHVSTDYVFDGSSSTPYMEWDRPNPRSVYGRSKLAGEHEVLSLLPGAAVVRSSWICGRYGPNMVKVILRLAGEPAPLRFVDDQRGCPTFADDLAAMLVQLAVSRAPGVFHVTNQGATSWYGFARDVLSAAGHDPEPRIAHKDRRPGPPSARATARQFGAR